ncbi:hypothetical protein LDL59_07940 [Kaistella anthropi]|nr:hypothetical protein [Kaistella anthropi]
MLDLVKEYASKRLDLLKMEATEKSSITAGTLAILIMVAVAGFFLLFYSILDLAFSSEAIWGIMHTDCLSCRDFIF